MRSGGSRPTVAKIDLNWLRGNLTACRSFLGPDVKIMGVVKADAYGHGAVECGRELELIGVDWLGTATPEEAIELRSAGIVAPILCLGGFWPGQEPDLVHNSITPALFELSSAQRLNAAATSLGSTISVHLKVDTGMGRLGFRFDRIANVLDAFRSLDRLRIEGVMTHFASADDPARAEFTDLQVIRFKNAVAAIRDAGHRPDFLHLSNTPGAVNMGPNGGNLVRLGGILYGLVDDTLPDGIPKPDVLPVMSVTSEIAHLKNVPAGESIGYGQTYVTGADSRIAAVPIGYHDGYRRGFSNKARMIVGGSFVPIVGRVSMDWTMIDVTAVPDASIGSEVIIIGAQNGAKITAADLAKLVDTISYEITCGFSRRVPRVFVGDQTT